MRIIFVISCIFLMSCQETEYDTRYMSDIQRSLENLQVCVSTISDFNKMYNDSLKGKGFNINRDDIKGSVQVYDQEYKLIIKYEQDTKIIRSMTLSTSVRELVKSNCYF